MSRPAANSTTHACGWHDVLEEGVPLVTHAGCRAVHDHPRNLADWRLEGLAERGGVLGMMALRSSLILTPDALTLARPLRPRGRGDGNRTRRPRSRWSTRLRHRATCKSLAGGRCTCRPAWEASIGSGRTAKIRRTFASQAAAKSWRADALTKLNRGELTAAQSRKIREAATELIDGMRAGTVRTRSGDEYKPSATRSYDEALRVHVLPAIGALRLSEARLKHVQAIVDRLHREGKSASTVAMR